jgi:hypothetical protein
LRNELMKEIREYAEVKKDLRRVEPCEASVFTFAN